MNSPTLTPAGIALALTVGALLVSGCSGSGNDPPPVDAGMVGPDDQTGTPGGTADPDAIDDDPLDDPTDETTDDPSVGTPPTGGPQTPPTDPDPAAPEDPANPAPIDPDPATPDPDVTDPTDPDASVPDPMVQNVTRVDFDIEVPAYRSDALQVRLTWDEKDFTADWIGDELWSASETFPTDTENLLNVTFSDGNGDIPLGTFEQAFRTGTNASESYRIAADRFDTDRWDSDGDGASNLDELIAGTDPAGSPRVLLFSETRGFRHDSIEDALDALEELAASAGIETDRAGDSAGAFTDANLAGYDAVAWVLTSGDVLDADEQSAFERYIRSGGGYAGIHAASDTEYDWPWYGDLVGAWFERHPAIQSATQVVEDASHASTAHLGPTWTRTDEWYDYRSNPRARVNVLLRLDEGSYSGGGMGDDHPSAWYHEHDGGRSWYTGGGHTAASYAEPEFRAHLLGGLRHAVGRDEPDDTSRE